MRKTKFFIIGDCHFNDFNKNVTNIMTREIYKFCEERINDYDYIVCLGDTFDFFSKFETETFNRVNDFIIGLTKYKKTYVLIGNHDLKNNKEFLTDNHPFHVLKETMTENLVIVDFPIVVTLNEQKYMFCPYSPKGKFITMLDTTGIDWKNEIRIIFCHQDFKGFNYGYKISEDGEEWDGQFPMIISGHFHEKQIKRNIFYPGTPIQTNFGESIKKGVHIVASLPDKCEIEFIRIRAPKKIKKEVRFKDIAKLELDDFNEYKIKIKCSATEKRLIKDDPKIGEFLKKGVKFEYNVKKEEITFTKSDFKELLLSKIKENPKMVEIYNKYFG